MKTHFHLKGCASRHALKKEAQNNSEIAYSIAHEEIRYAKSYNMFKILIFFLSTDHDEGHVIDKLEVKNLFEEMDLVRQLHGS